jgi:hypothetical protein
MIWVCCGNGVSLYTVAVVVALGALGDLFPSLTGSPYGIAAGAALVTAALWPFWRRESYPFLRVAAASINQLAFVAFAIIEPAWWLLVYLRDRIAA